MGAFLERWTAEWAAAPSTREEAEEDGADWLEEIETGLGFPPADEERITALERRLGAKLPPSYRSFLAVSDGWRPAGIAVHLMGTTEGVHWHRDAMGFLSVYVGFHRGNFAIRHGRPHAVVTGPWIRPPGPDEPRVETVPRRLPAPRSGQ